MLLTLLNENVSAVVAHQGRYSKQFPAPQNAAPGNAEASVAKPQNM